MARELATTRVRMDVGRGVPVTHIRYSGYDQAALYRNADSKLAHRALKGIDRSIRHIFDDARRSRHRHYALWIHSGHGQHLARPYALEFGRTIDQAVLAVFHDFQAMRRLASSPCAAGSARRNLATTGVLSNAAVDRIQPATDSTTDSRPRVVTRGCVGHLHLPHELPSDGLEQFCRLLVRDAGIPLVLMADGASAARAWDGDGGYKLPRDGAELLGAELPFVSQVARDLAQLCHDRDAGNIVICGWRRNAAPISFATEPCAPAGSLPEQVQGFALLPADTPLPTAAPDHIHPAHVHTVAPVLSPRF
jgi:hypothetical protein